jgi:group II intron reverse transcriptase/maturase
MILIEKERSQPINGRQVWDGFKAVKKNGGSAGVDGISIKDIESNPRKYLYPIFVRMASGSYYPLPVRQELIPKYDGTKRALGISTVCDRVAQTVIKEEIESIAEKSFSKNSFGYRPGKSAHQAVEQCRINCMKYNWAIDLDIKGFFDNIDHRLMMRALKRFTTQKHHLLYCRRWLTTSVQLEDGTIKLSEGKGTPQGGVISPLLANIFLHYAFDMWFEENYPELAYERYADDIIIHCKHFKQALSVLDAVNQRMKRCKLELKKQKTNIVYCKGNQRKHPPFKPKYVSFDFLGFTFKPRIVRSHTGRIYRGFTPAISKKAQRVITNKLFKLKLHRMVHLQLPQVANVLASKLRGWLYYFGKFRMSAMRYIMRVLNFRLIRWVRNKHKRFKKKHWYFAYLWLKETSKKYPTMFVHWKVGFVP